MMTVDIGVSSLLLRCERDAASDDHVSTADWIVVHTATLLYSLHQRHRLRILPTPTRSPANRLRRQPAGNYAHDDDDGDRPVDLYRARHE